MQFTNFKINNKPTSYTAESPISKGTFLTLGVGSYVDNSDIHCANIEHGHVLIGNFCSLAQNVTLLVGMNHDYRYISTFPFRTSKVLDRLFGAGDELRKIPSILPNPNHYQVIIGNDVWIGHGATILSGVKIGNGAIVGANSTVTKDIPPYAIAVGSPARVIKYRFDEETRRKLNEIKWWNWPLDKIKDNLLLLEQPEEFLEKFYPEVKVPPKQDLDVEVEKLKNSGRTIYTFVLDFVAMNPLWKRVIKGYINTFHDRDETVLILFFDKTRTQEQIDEVVGYVDSFKKEYKAIPLIDLAPAVSIYNFPYINTLRMSDCFISSKEAISSFCIDYLSDTNAKIVAAMDDVIFPGEYGERTPISF